jgi:hypothetical protein
MLVRAAVLAGGTGFIFTPRRWLAQMKTLLLRKLPTPTAIERTNPE